MVKRRSMVVGLGALATGSGAVFSSAAFSSSVNSAADMRVVVGEGLGNNLRVSAGNIFRDNDGDFQSANPTSDAVKTAHDISDTTFFASNKLEDLEVADLPAAGANNMYNEDLSLAVATAVGETAEIGNGGFQDKGFIQIENNTPDDHDIQIGFNEFGDEVNGPVTKEEVRQIYEFYDINGNKISEKPNGAFENSVTVTSGSVEQIYLEVDTEDGDLYDAVMDATGVEDSPFTEDQDTVDLVDSIQVGVTED
ncbi:hypothetical protein EXE46_14685 [Halorubrum sp. GN11_10-6_MGM]|uniref:hypothetical protein n=1 Tax=Halorubrum sp. GN11_10-6_MGM TaxID=2518112 RepID=UPI0010F84677|nr:hypothetical protein [Halorubrum sp. GN11_10-6_MGM]TKX73133.1 hypothetical protein EXE46_14685 [Halorubrum sp. GN11_10-6_MGM]